MIDEKELAEASEKAKAVKRAALAKNVMVRMMNSAVCDGLQSKDLDPKLTEWVGERLDAGETPHDICKQLGISVASKQWRKVQAYFRQGFRTDAEVYIFQQTHKFYQVIEKARKILDDAFENGTPHVAQHEDGSLEIVRVKGATKELGSFLKSYSDSISLPVKLWKDLGAIGQPKEKGTGGVTILVKNNIELPSLEDIKKHQEEIKAKAEAIEVKAIEKK